VDLLYGYTHKRTRDLIPAINRELAENSLTSASASLVILGLFFLSNFSEFSRAPYFLLGASFVAIGNSLRWLISIRYVRAESCALERWTRFFPSVVLLSGVGWGIVLSGVFLTYGSSHFCTNVGLLLVSGIASSSLIGFGAAPRLYRLFISTLLLVPIGIFFSISLGQPEMIFPVLFSVFFVFLIQQGRVHARNVREKFRNQNQVEMDRDILQDVLDAVPGYLSCIDQDGRYVAMNLRLRTQLQIKDHEFLGKSVGEIVGRSQSTEAIMSFLHSPHQNLTRQVELEVGTETRWHLMCLRKSDTTNWIVCISIDIHQEKLLELEAEGHRAKSQNSSKFAALGEMASGIAHEINNPLTIIIGKSALLKRQIEQGAYEPEKVMTGLTQIETTGNRIAKIIKGLRSFSRNSEHDPMEDISVSQLIQDTLEICSERFKIHSVKVSLEFDSNADARIHARPAQLGQVFLNLLNNSFDAITALDEKWIQIKVERNQSRVLIRFTDSGEGISKAIRDKVMQPFFTTKEVGKGTGLGLSISKGIIEEHKGSLQYNEASSRTQFVIDLPDVSAAKEQAA